MAFEETSPQLSCNSHNPNPSFPWHGLRLVAAILHRFESKSFTVSAAVVITPFFSFMQQSLRSEHSAAILHHRFESKFFSSTCSNHVTTPYSFFMWHGLRQLAEIYIIASNAISSHQSAAVTYYIFVWRGLWPIAANLVASKQLLSGVPWSIIPCPSSFIHHHHHWRYTVD